MNIKKAQESTDFFASMPFYPYGTSNDLFAEQGPYGFNDGGSQISLARRDNRLTGESLPTYINWFQLKMIRDRSRVICKNNEYAIAAVNAHIAYVVGTGLTYVAMPRKKTVSEAVVRQVQELIDLFRESAELPNIEAEAIRRLHVDGECFIRVFPQKGGLIALRFIEPELVRSPSDNTTKPDHSFGIESDPEDAQTIRGYWVIERPFESLTPTLIEAENILHLKLNTDSNSKRGLPTTYAVEGNFKFCEELLTSLITLAKARAKFAVIRKVKDAPPDALAALSATSTDATITDPNSGQTSNLNRFGYGSILTSSDNIDYEFPAANLDAGGMVEALQANLRAIASRYGITETMMSADASNNNFASALVAEGPAHRSFKRMQAILGQAFGERRLNPNRSLIWRQIRAAVERGILPAEVLTDVTIKCEGPSLVTRDTDREATTNRTYLEMGIKSKQTICSELGLDYETESKNLKADPAQPQQQQPGADGAQGQPAQDAAGAEGAGGAPQPDKQAPTF
jgi:capsid protein